MNAVILKFSTVSSGIFCLPPLSLCVVHVSVFCVHGDHSPVPDYLDTCLTAHTCHPSTHCGISHSIRHSLSIRSLLQPISSSLSHRIVLPCYLMLCFACNVYFSVLEDHLPYLCLPTTITYCIKLIVHYSPAYNKGHY